jgi:hypothetical protein
MRIDVDISVETDYVCLCCTGTYSLSEVKRLYQSAIDAALEHHKSKAEQIVGRAFGKIGRFAVVGQEPLIDEERFGETVAVNRGINAKATTSLDEAISWLRL